MSIYVIDEMMGRGKTSAMINYINQSGDDVRYLFIVPLLTEVERIRKGCASKDFVEPSQFGGKLNNIKQLLAEGRNIVSTHALFSRFDDETLQYIKDGNYTLVMDERICDGTYYASAFKYLRYYLKNPDELTRPPESVVEDIY